MPESRDQYANMSGCCRDSLSGDRLWQECFYSVMLHSSSLVLVIYSLPQYIVLIHLGKCMAE